MAWTHNHLPEELLLKLFLPQPVKSLLRFRCVCKFWYQVISSQSFIKSHLAHQKTCSNKNNYLLLDYGTSSSANLTDSESYHFFKCDKYDADDNMFVRDSTNNNLEVYGICDGLLCLSVGKACLYSDAPIFIWNPVVRKGKKLPPLRIKPLRSTCLCFGYHDDDYKVINVFYDMHKYHVHIYSLRTDNWKLLKFDININIEFGDDRFDIWPYPKARLVNGVAYFVRNISRCRVVSFDLSSEIMQERHLPDGFKFNDDCIMEEYGESIALIGSTRDILDRHSLGDVVMYVLKVSDNSYSWEKKFTFESEGRLCFDAVGFINKDKLVMRHNMDLARKYLGKYLFHNVENGSQQKLKSYPEWRRLEEVKKNVCPFRVNDFTESLVLLTETTTPFLEMQPYSPNKTTTPTLEKQAANSTGRRNEHGDRVIRGQGLMSSSITRRIYVISKILN